MSRSWTRYPKGTTTKPVSGGCSRICPTRGSFDAWIWVIASGGTNCWTPAAPSMHRMRIFCAINAAGSPACPPWKSAHDQASCPMPFIVRNLQFASQALVVRASSEGAPHSIPDARVTRRNAARGIPSFGPFSRARSKSTAQLSSTNCRPKDATPSPSCSA